MAREGAVFPFIHTLVFAGLSMNDKSDEALSMLDVQYK